MESCSTQIKTKEDRKVFTLFQLNRSIKNALETKTGNSDFWVKAEIAKVTHSRSGHVYFDLVEESNGSRKATIRAMLWRDTFNKVKQDLGESYNNVIKTGSEIIFQCKVKFNEIHGLSLEISNIDLTFMLGELERKKAETLEYVKREGIQHKNTSLKLPTVLHKIALIGSPGTSGYRDFTHHVLHNEWLFRFDIEEFPTAVQGTGASSSICKALEKANSSNSDVIVLIRGGGSSLDLDCFNDINLAIKIGELTTPILTGIGHETDFSIADFVAHRYFKTPTDVGDFIVDKSMMFSSLLIDIATRIGIRSKTIIHREKTSLSNAKTTLVNLPARLITTEALSLDKIKTDLYREFQRVLIKQKETLSGMLSSIELIKPENTLSRGYSIVRSEGKSIKDSKELKRGDQLEIELHKGKLIAEVLHFNKK
tara:strand:- start:1012 stop:2286 length:1275 start_codon:yes stop_codon:yes gene_type:complete